MHIFVKSERSCRMTMEGSYHAAQLIRQIRAVRQEIEDLPGQTLNEVLAIQPTNTLFQLGTHIAGSARFWAITNTGGTDFHRDRDAEFMASGSPSELIANLDELIQQISDHVSKLTAEQLDQPVSIASASFSNWDEPGLIPQRHALLHAIAHTALHLGHIQLTRQVLGIAPLGE
jgi:hypothetical protein